MLYFFFSLTAEFPQIYFQVSGINNKFSNLKFVSHCLKLHVLKYTLKDCCVTSKNFIVLKKLTVKYNFRLYTINLN